ncbi:MULTISPECIES: LacI family DNA-binding transcriptional regulator [Corynebacterium]|uniref:LacI family DNA-binding transcriptional regulator n=1 Tax=Corynebacterium TaxID=1716 RepID=UPI000EDC7567|nr:MULTISPECIES: LacI family DNA-binding transcriptional regulator [Corynebacterium]HCG46436.1 transcriptional regulator [Corynebacterium flavescens]
MSGATLKDVAAAAGVSVSTASRSLADNPAISEATRRRVKKAAASLNYHPNAQARALRSSRSNAIGLVIPSLVNPYFAAMAAAIEEAAEARGFATIITSSAEDGTKLASALDALSSRQVDGIVAVPMHGAEEALVATAALRPLLLVDRHLGDLPAVVSDPTPGIAAALALLKRRGHSRIGYLSGPDSTSTGRERLEVFLRESSGLDVIVHDGGFRRKEGYKATLDLLDSQVTAIVAGDSMMTFGALEACHNAQVDIGKQLALVGFDDFVFLRYQPSPVSVIDQEVDRLGVAAVDSLIHAIETKTTPRGVVHPTRFIPRPSTAYGPQSGPALAAQQ